MMLSVSQGPRYATMKDAVVQYVVAQLYSMTNRCFFTSLIPSQSTESIMMISTLSASVFEVEMESDAFFLPQHKVVMEEQIVQFLVGL